MDINQNGLTLLCNYTECDKFIRSDLVMASLVLLAIFDTFPVSRNTSPAATRGMTENVPVVNGSVRVAMIAPKCVPLRCILARNLSFVS